MGLRKKQSKFLKMWALLILYADTLGYETTPGHLLRCEDCKVGHKRSLHKLKLAGDLNLFKDDILLSSTADHEPLGLFWESMGGSWGGRFRDGGHYSLEHNGMK
jgi:hypothetical protein